MKTTNKPTNKIYEELKIYWRKLQYDSSNRTYYVFFPNRSFSVCSEEKDPVPEIKKCIDAWETQDKKWALLNLKSPYGLLKYFAREIINLKR